MAGQSFFELSTLIDSLPPMADGESARDNFAVTFRDDRVMDQGLDSIRVLSATALEAAPYTIEPGAPQATITVRPTVSGSGGRIVFEASDVAGNVSYFTVCYVFDSRSERYVYQLNEGRGIECVSEDGWMVGAYGLIENSRLDADFVSSGNLEGQGPFQQGEGLGGGFGVLVGRRMSPDLIVNGRLSVSGLGGTLLSADTTVGAVFDSASGSQVPYQEGTELSIDALFLKLGGTVQWFPLRYFYLTGGAQLSFALGNAVSVNRVLLRPGHFTYADGTRSQSTDVDGLESLSTFGFELQGGLGFSYPISFRGSLFLESMYTTRLNSLISDGTFDTESIGLKMGLIWRF